MDEELSNLPYKGAELYGIKNKILIIQVTDSRDLKFAKEEINIGKPKAIFPELPGDF